MEKISLDRTNSKFIHHGFRKAFIRNSILSPESRLLLIILMSYKGENSQCWPSVGSLSKNLGRNRDSVRKYIKELKSNGYLITNSRGMGRSLLYTPSYWGISAGPLTIIQQDEQPAEKTVHQPDETTLNRSIVSENKDNKFKSGKELFDQKRKELELL